MVDVDLKPSGTSRTDQERTTQQSSPGVHVIREPKDLLQWPPALPPADYTEAVDSIEDLPNAESTIQLGLLREPTIQLIKAIPVEIRRDGQIVTASWNEAEEYGCGQDRSEALEDFGRNVSQLFISLSAEESALGNDLKRVLALLRSHLKFRSR